MTALRSPHFAVSRSSHFSVSRLSGGAAEVVELHGDLDLSATEELFAEFDSLLKAGSAAVIVDLRDLSFMDAHGIRALISLRAGCEEQGRRLVLIRGQRAVHRLLAVCGIEPMFAFVDSVSDARELLGDGPHAPSPPRGRLPAAPVTDELARRRDANLGRVPDSRLHHGSFVRHAPTAGAQQRVSRRSQRLG